MSRGYYNGSDWVSYNSGTLAKSTATSAREIKKQESVKCPKCGRKVPKKAFCIFCDYVF